jgi:hypothetical protein
MMMVIMMMMMMMIIIIIIINTVNLECKNKRDIINHTVN